MTPTAALLAHAAAPHALPATTAEAATRLLLDTLAVGCAGSTHPQADGVYAAAHRAGTQPEARLLGRSERLPAPAAALVNGFQIHCLEWDAVHEPAVVHALSVVTAALLAVIDRRQGCEPDRALAALALGVDIACGLGLAATSPLAFFRPATAGLIGAAFACARVEGLPAGRYPHLLGLAYSQCAGTMQAHVEGSVALPLQIGLAARAAITAVDLALYDLTGPHDALEGPFGYFALFDRGDLARYTETLTRPWRIEEVSTKPFPCGRASHATLAALANHRHAREIIARVPPLVARLVDRPWAPDKTPAYARLCLPFLTALMLRDGMIDPRAFTPASFADAHLQALGQRLRIEVDHNPDPNALTPQALIVDGQRLAIAHTLGSPQAPLTPAQRQAKLGQALALARDPAQNENIAADPLGWLARGTA